jgi:hypothetical protein
VKKYFTNSVLHSNFKINTNLLLKLKMGLQIIFKFCNITDFEVELRLVIHNSIILIGCSKLLVLIAILYTKMLKLSVSAFF